MRKNIYNGPEFPELQTHNISGLRFYEVPNGDKYPSITSVLGAQPGKKKGLDEWRKRVGDAQANIISRKSARRGTVFHHIIEDHLTDNLTEEQIEKHKTSNFLAWCMFGETRKVIDERVGDIYLMEQTMFSEKYKVAGRCDLIALLDGVVTVIDWKISTRIKKAEWMTDYYIQATAYADMFTSHAGIPVDDIGIIMCSEDGEVEVFQEKVSDYTQQLDDMMGDFYTNAIERMKLQAA